MNKESISLRRYQPQDHDAVWNLHNDVLNELGTHGGNGPWDDDLHHIEEVYLRNKGEFFVGVANNTIIAIGGLKRVNRDVAEIKRMRVNTAWRRKGIGQLILNRLEEKAKELGYQELVLDTTTRQTGAQLFYKKNSYHETHRGRYGKFDVIYYKKKIICVV